MAVYYNQLVRDLERMCSEKYGEEIIRPQIGEIWFVRVLDSKTLKEQKVLDMTAKTVQLTAELNWEPSRWEKYRYLWEDVEFVERVK